MVCSRNDITTITRINNTSRTAPQCALVISTPATAFDCSDSHVLHHVLHHVFTCAQVALDPRQFVGVDSIADAVDYLYSGRSLGKVVVQLAAQPPPAPPTGTGQQQGGSRL